MPDHEWARWTERDDVSDDELLRHWQRLIRHIVGTARRTYKLTWDDGTDIEQTMKVKLLQVPHDKRPLEQYCRTVLSNSVRSALRDTLRRGATPQNSWLENGHKTLDYTTAAPGNDPYAEESVEDIDRITSTVSPEQEWCDSITLRDAMDVLTDRERQVITLLYYHDLTLREIAEQLNLPRGTVNYSSRTAKEKLRNALSAVKKEGFYCDE